MTDKELRKLKRFEILEIMVAQGREGEKLKKKLQTTEEELSQLQETYERLRKKLDDKDAKIQNLRDTLEAERNERRIISEEAGNIAEASLRMNRIFDAAQETAELYLHNVRLTCREKEQVLDERIAQAGQREEELETENAELAARVEELEQAKAELEQRLEEEPAAEQREQKELTESTEEPETGTEPEEEPETGTEPEEQPEDGSGESHQKGSGEPEESPGDRAPEEAKTA